ncbi:PREDICTED: receptor protein kinase-like protein ZAR1 [Ipomoea nil]|uniref:receptor protein kinase-like protein ZAR1 n=1 Tax=Ipomoea nil TaxID=35883 RepID=UPI0009017D1E|nr:PREDICTED: receptor protein kinase-like protein ZAR1 [Ipomoea nil]
MNSLNFAPPFFFFFFFVVSVVPLCSSLSSDGLSLLALKAAINSDPAQVLASWSESDSTPCQWAGIACDDTHRVTSVSLSGSNLAGYLPSEIGALSSLASLNLSGNNFSNLIPAHLFNATSLVSLDLSRNSFSGPLPPQITTLTTLTHLDLSSNLLNGSLPEDLISLSHLVGALNLSYNSFSGQVPASYGRFPATLSLDLRHNNLTGKIPTEGSLLNQGPTAFTGNPYLCGFPLETQCPEPEAQNPRIFPNQEPPKDPIFSSNELGERGKARNGSGAVSLISGVSVVIGVVFFSVWAYRKKWNSVEENPEKQNPDTTEAHKTEEGQKEKEKYSVLDEGFSLEIEDLLRASAYVVGKSRSGIVYKVVVGGSAVSGGATVVAVRRLSEGDSPWSFREFEAAVEAIARVQHPNIVRLRAYYYASDEKLLITDFIHNGSLYNALHGGPGNLLVAPLSWAMRLKIARGIARGLVHIHECGPKRYVHGNIKSSKILLDEDLKPYISGFGLTRLVPSLSGQKGMNSNQFIISPRSSNSSFEAPEARAAGSKLTQKCDVYSFGVVLLEILTGRLPDGGGGGADEDGKGIECVVRKAFREERPLSEIIDPALMHEVHAKKQVVATFHIALNCTELDPELRPRMRAVADSLDRVKSQ